MLLALALALALELELELELALELLSLLRLPPVRLRLCWGCCARSTVTRTSWAPLDANMQMGWNALQCVACCGE